MLVFYRVNLYGKQETFDRFAPQLVLILKENTNGQTEIVKSEDRHDHDQQN